MSEVWEFLQNFLSGMCLLLAYDRIDWHYRRKRIKAQKRINRRNYLKAQRELARLDKIRSQWRKRTNSEPNVDLTSK
jgi:hypothetical protein